METQALLTPQAQHAERLDDAANDHGAASPRPVRLTADSAKHIQQALGRAIRARRRILNRTQTQLAKACNVTYQQVQKYESGRCGISAAQLWTVAVALQVPVEYFYDSVTASELSRLQTARD